MTRFKRLCVFFALFTAAAAAGRAETPVDRLIGTWRIDAVWSDGTALWAQAEYRPVLGGAFVEGRVFVRDGGGPLYQRYRSFFTGAEEPGAVIAHTFSADGASAESRLQVEGPVITTVWSAGEMTIAERMELESAEVMRWQVWITGAGDDRKEIMDGKWRRVDADPIVLPTVGELDAGVAALEPWFGGWETSTEQRRRVAVLVADGAPGRSRGSVRRRRSLGPGTGRPEHPSIDHGRCRSRR